MRKMIKLRTTLKKTHGIVLLLSCVSCLGCSSSVPRIAVQGEIAGQLIETTVDSQIAKYFLEHYLMKGASRSELGSEIDRLLESHAAAIPSREILGNLSRETSVDFAALYFADRVLKIEDNRTFSAELTRNLSRLRVDLEIGGLRLHASIDDYMFLFVPGWVYKSETENGADFAAPRRILTQRGVANYLIEIDETGTIEENAAFVASEVIRYSSFDKNLIMVSASSGGPAVNQTLGELLTPEQSRKVKAWINVGGILQGSLLADAAVRWPKRWLIQPLLLLKGWDYDSVESMATTVSRKRFARADIPTWIFCLNYVGVPLSGDVTERARTGYMDLRKHGPNDGLSLLSDELIPNSVTIPELGVDHFYLDPEMDLKTVALAQLVVSHLEASKRDPMNEKNR